MGPDRTDAARLRSLVHNSFDLTTISDVDGKILYVTPSVERILGYVPGEVVGQNILSFVHSVDTARASEAFVHAVNTPGILEPIVARVRHRDGSWRVIEAAANNLLGDPAVGGIVHNMHDITARYEAEAAVRQSERQLRAYLDQANDLIWTMDSQGRIRSVNDKACTTLGYTAEELIGRSALELVEPRHAPRLAASLAAILRGETIDQVEAEVIAKGGHRVWLEIRGHSFREGESLIQIFEIARDVTERRKAEEATRQSEGLYRSMLNSSPDALAITDMEGRIRIHSPAALTIFGFDAAENLSGRLITEFVVPEDRERARANMGRMYERSLDRSQRRPDEYRAVRADGSVFDVDVMGDLIREADGPPTGMIFVVRDITERKRAEESAARLAAIVESSNDGILMLAPDRTVLSWNSGAESLYGWPAAEAVGRPLSELVSAPPELREAQTAILGGAFAGIGMAGYDTVRFGRDGKRVDVSLTVFPIRDPNGAVVAVAGIHRGIGERKQAEEALAQSEERFRATFEQAAVGIAHLAPDGRWLRVNQRFCDIVGYTREELLQRSFQDLTHPGDIETNLEAMRRLLADEIRTYSGEKRYVRKDGSPVWVDLTVSLVRSPSGEPDYFISVAEDITRRKQSEAMLELESAALSAAADAIMITDAAGTIEWVNPAFALLTGYTAEEAIGRNPRELVKSGIHDQATYKELWETILAGNVWEGELTNRRKDGSLWDEEQIITPVRDASGAIAHFIAIKRDITERKRLEAQFLQSQKMESVGQLAGGIAHDFNNLLNVINGTAFLVSEQLKADDPLRDDLREITRAADRAAAMTRQLLTMSRKQIMQPKVLDLRTLVADLQGMLRRLIGEDIELVVVPAKDPCNIRADPGQIQQVILNLAVNARDAMPTGGTLAMATEAVSVDAARGDSFPPVPPGRYVLLTVSDTGIGMDEATRARIFEPFFTTKEVGKGTGLGLSTVFGIVVESGGRIRVDSQMGSGTSFRIWFPQLDEATPLDQTVPQAASARGAETILVVEDYPELRLLARRMLERAGYAVLVAGDGGEALRLLEHHRGKVDLLLTDVVMPGIGGRELAAHVLKEHPEIKVLYTSGYTDDAIVRHGVHADAAHFLNKPYSHEDLTRAVRTVLDTQAGKPS